MPGRRNKNVKFLAAGCFHAPLHDREHVEWICGHVKLHRPDVLVVTGDLFEADGVSRWESDYDFSLEEEYRAANLEVLKPLRQSAPRKCRCVFLPGNHDDNILAVGRGNRKLKSLYNWRRKQFDEDNFWLNEEMLTHWDYSRKYNFDRDEGCFRLGQVTFAHGWQTGQNADEWHSYLLGFPWGLYVGSHTHRPAAVTQGHRVKGLPLPYYYANTGCSTEMSRDYMQRSRKDLWGHGLVIGDCDPAKIITRCPIERRWTAETIVRKMYGD